jgi:hypothetical protein
MKCFSEKTKVEIYCQKELTSQNCTFKEIYCIISQYEYFYLHLNRKADPLVNALVLMLAIVKLVKCES